MIVTNVLLEPQAFGPLKTVNLCRENERKRTVSHYRSAGAARTSSRSTRRCLRIAIELAVWTRNSTLRRERKLRQATIDHNADAG